MNNSIIFVSDMKQGVAFYCDVMGLPLKFETPARARIPSRTHLRGNPSHVTPPSRQSRDTVWYKKTTPDVYRMLVNNLSTSQQRST